MSEQTIKLLELINQGKTCNEICQILKISSKQLYNNLTNLRNKGFFFKRKYYCDGSIIYRTIKSRLELINYYESKENSIITSNSLKQIKALVISDLHFGNQLERLDLINRIYNYCTKNGINLIFCCGDLIDGTFTKGEQKISRIYDQIEHFIKNYPFDKNILTFGVGGDHDMSSFKQGQNFLEIINNYHHDIVIPNYAIAFLNIKNDKIGLYHFINNFYLKDKECPLIFCGHSHQYKTDFDKNVLTVNVPSLSLINKSLPTAIEISLSFKKGYIEYVDLKQLYFGIKNYTLSEMRYNLLENRKVEIKPINNEEKIEYESINLEDILEVEKGNNKQVKTKKMKQ